MDITEGMEFSEIEIARDLIARQAIQAGAELRHKSALIQEVVSLRQQLGDALGEVEALRQQLLEANENEE